MKTSPDIPASNPITAEGQSTLVDGTGFFKTVIAIPAFNEERRIADVVSACRKVGCSSVWVMDDGSIDQTQKKAEDAGAIVHRHEKNLGKGMAIRTALEIFKKSEFDYLIFLDADGQHDPEFIPSFISAATSMKADIVIGNRMESTDSMPLVRLYTNRTMSYLISRLCRQSIPDTQCGFRLVSKRFADVFTPTTERFDLESEMLIQACRKGLLVKIVPISTIYKGHSSHIHPFWDTLRFIRFLWSQRS